MGKLMFLPLQTESHINICISIAKKFLKMFGDQHEIHVIVCQEWEEKLSTLSPEIKIAKFYDPNEQLQKEWLARTGKNKGEILEKLCDQYIEIWNSSDNKQIDMVNSMVNFYENYLTQMIKLYPFITKIIQNIKPDFIINCLMISTPVAIDQNIPYAKLFTCSPTFFGSDNLPPPMSDLPTEPTIENRKLWSGFFDKNHLLAHCDLKKKFNEWLKKNNCPNLDERMYYIVESPYLNIQLYPEPLDYKIEFPGKWLQLHSVISELPKPLEIPNKLQNLPGKLIYIHLGYKQCIYSFLLNQLVTMLPEIKHRFIISSDLNNDHIAPNMYANNQIDPLAALQIADLTIYHGGTKMMTDAFHFGVPGLIISLLGDQIDNGRRVVDKKLGIRLYPNEFTKESLEEAINKCLDDLNLRRKLKEISLRAQENNGLENVCNEIAKYLIGK